MLGPRPELRAQMRCLRLRRLPAGTLGRHRQIVLLPHPLQLSPHRVWT
ncbi:hypothetical protein [Streptomyces griseus]